MSSFGNHGSQCYGFSWNFAHSFAYYQKTCNYKCQATVIFICGVMAF